MKPAYLQTEIKRLQDQIAKYRPLLQDPEMKNLAKEEISKLEKQIKQLEQPLPVSKKETPSNENSPYANSPAILEIRSAAGGEEAKLFSEDLLRMYTRFANNNGFNIKPLDEHVIKITKTKNSNWSYGPYETFQFESGVHRVQRVPTTESQGRVHTSTASVAVLPELKPNQVDIKDADLEWSFSRAGGPGGQNVNKVSTAVRLTHIPSQLVISVRQERNQQRNREIALDLLRSRLWQAQEIKRLQNLKDKRSQAIGRGMRAEKIKTYNFPQNRLTDHRFSKSWHNLKDILEGSLEDVLTTTIEALNSSDEK